MLKARPASAGPAPLLAREEARRRLAENLIRILKRRQTDSRTLARETGLCYRIIHRATRGEVDPCASFIVNLAAALNTRVEAFFRPLKNDPA